MKKYSIVMPDLGEGVLEGELVSWKVSVGDSVKEDDLLAEVMTDKASLEIPSTAEGQVKELKIKPGQTCAVGDTLAVIEGSASDSSVDSSKGVSSSESAQSAGEKAPSQQTNQNDLDKPAEKNIVSQSASPLSIEKNLSGDESSFIAPVVRRWAEDHGIDLSQVRGTGLAGRITLDDVQKISGLKTTFAPPAGHQKTPVSSSFGPEERKPFQGIQKKMAQSMQFSKQVIPHFTIVDQAQVDPLVRLREQAKKLYPDSKITYLSFVMKILHNNMREFPVFNASVDDQTKEIVYKKYFNFGFATDTPRGLLVPVVKNVDQKNIVQISREIKELSDRARKGSITVDEMKGGTITITNLGSIAGQWATPVINPPETAILGMYQMSTAPVFDGNMFQPVKVMNFSITSDHRVIDGATAARFMSQFIERVENPSLLLLEN